MHLTLAALGPRRAEFFLALGPAVIGSGSVQLAIFADTIIASFLPAGPFGPLDFTLIASINCQLA